MTNSYPRETDEPMEVTVTVDGVPVTTGVEVALTTAGARPATWALPIVSDGRLYVRIFNLAPGTWRVWARPTTPSGKPVIDCGSFFIS